MKISLKAYEAYRLFVARHCPRQGEEIILCKDCKHYKGRCWHNSHPKQPLFTK